MSNHPFVLPAGLDLQIGETLSVRHGGDVTLQQSFGVPLGLAEAGGDLTIALQTVSGNLKSGGKLTIEGRIDAGSIHGREVYIGAQDVKCRAISADVRIVIGAAKLSVDIIIAPEVVIDPKASGRVTVIESTTETGPTKIKGGFSLAEYEEAVGDPVTFLDERGLTALAVRMAAASEAQKAAPAKAAPAVPAPTAPAPTVPTPSRAPTPPAVPPRAAAPRPEAPPKYAPPTPVRPIPTPIVVEEDVGDPMSLSVEDLEPIHEPAEKDELHPKLMEAVQRISTCYEGKEVPPAVSKLRELVEARDYDRLRENITEVWNGLLGYHQKKGIRPHHQVTHAFNVIHGLVQQG